MLTLAFAQIVWAVALQWADFTGGDNGVLGVWPTPARSPTRASSTGWHWRFARAARCCCAGFCYAPFGYALRAARDSPLRAEAIGLPGTGCAWRRS